MDSDIVCVAGLAGGASVVICAVIVVRVALLAAEGRGGATNLPGYRLVLVEEPLRFLLRSAEGRRGQRRPWPGSLTLAPADGGGDRSSKNLQFFSL